eukprot:6351813-Alexandrium_andersonii.AAC.1
MQSTVRDLDCRPRYRVDSHARCESKHDPRIASESNHKSLARRARQMSPLGRELRCSARVECAPTR